MERTEVKPHDIMTCPYNMSHQVEHYRMHIHLQKCRKQHPNSKKGPCPFDATHIINDVELDVEHYRMHIHLQKCRKQHPNSKKGPCPFDATHIINDVELDYHVAFCPKRAMFDTQVYVMDDDQKPPVNVVHSANSDAVQDDWENEPHVSTYKPDYSKKGAHVIKKIKGATPSERRKARMEGVKNYKPVEQ